MPVILASACNPSCTRPVRVAPGLIPLTRMPLPPKALAKPTVASMSAALAAPPGRWTGFATLPPEPMMLTITPRPRGTMRFSTASVG